MSAAWLWVVAGLITWLILIAFGLALCIIGKRADNDTERARTSEESPAGGTGRSVSSQRAFLGRRQR